MATLGSLVGIGKNTLRYLITHTDLTPFVLTDTGAPSPDLLTDTAGRNGVLRKMATVFTTGYGQFPAGALTQAQARAMLANDASGANVGNANIPRAQCSAVARSGSNTYQVDVGVDGAGHPTITVTPGINSAGSCYLDLAVPGAIGA